MMGFDTAPRPLPIGGHHSSHSTASATHATIEEHPHRHRRHDDDVMNHNDIKHVGGAPSGSPPHPPSSLSRQSSVTSMDPDMMIDDLLSSDELDKLSNCLSEASSEPRLGGSIESNSLLYDIFQAQLSLWMCVGSLMYSYAWRQHRKKFLISIFFVIPTVIAVCCAISCLLTTIVIVSRVFSTPFAYNEFLSYANGHVENGNHSPQPVTRIRSYSGASSISSAGVGDDILPKPLCRRHSSTSSVSGPVIIPCSSRPPSAQRKLSYCYSHNSASHENIADIK